MLLTERSLDNGPHFAGIISVLDVLTTVVKLLALGECDFELEISAFVEICLGRHHGESGVLLPSGELENISFMQQQLAYTGRLVVEVRARVFERRDVDVMQEELAVVDTRVAVADVHLAQANRLDLCAHKLDAALVRFEKLIPHSGNPVLYAGRVVARLLGHHRQSCDPLRRGTLELVLVLLAQLTQVSTGRAAR
jgi:hypothetical protein